MLMAGLPKTNMTVDEFLAWSEHRDERWELFEGVPAAMAPERIEHTEIKFTAATALAGAIRRAKIPCQALPDGATIRISKRTAYKPDALVRCGPRLPRGSLEVPDPVVVLEVLSPSSAARDYGEKVDGYFSVPSIQHYLILAPDQRKVVHCRRGRGDVIERRLVSSGAIHLDPPGLEVDVEAMLGAE
jgi:Uma2 family endonuclease